MSVSSGLRTAQNYISNHFVGCEASFLAGSVIRGEGTATSDLDIVIVLPDLSRAYRQSVVADNWPIELFVHSPTSLRQFFESDIARRVPSLVRMCAEGIIINSSAGQAELIQSESQALLEKGPAPLTQAERDSSLYVITDLLDDLIGNQTVAENSFIVAPLVNKVFDFILSHQGHWLGSGKWVWRQFLKAEPEHSDIWLNSILKAHQGDTHFLIEQITDLLNSHGGRFFEGYYSQAPL